MATLIGILVGGRATRMGGIDKGLLPAPDTGEPIVLRLAHRCREALPDAQIVLVGNRDGYGGLGLDRLADAPGLAGPMAGLVSLFETAGDRAIALACDLPSVSRELVARLDEHAPDAAAVAPRLDGIWQPLFARYAAKAALEAAKTVTAPWRVLEALAAVELPIAESERSLLGDWDTPQDVR